MATNRNVLIGAASLAFGAAFANIAVVLATGTSVSHLTGDISRLSIDLAKPNTHLISDLTRVTTATLSFFSGAFLAGLWIHHPELDLKRPYARALSLVGLAFIISSFTLPHLPTLAIALSAIACGFQNSLATRYRGLVLRTTHLTGLVTDLGITLGMSARGFKIAHWKLAVPAILIAAYLAGGLASCLTYQHLAHHTLTTIGSTYLLGAFIASRFLLPRPSPQGESPTENQENP